MTATKTASRTSRQAAQKARPLAVVTAKPEDAKPEPERAAGWKPEDVDLATGEVLVPDEKAKRAAKPELPTAAGDLGARQVTYWFPRLTLADGTVIECVHARYGHEGPKAAERCLKALAAVNGVRLS